MPSLQGHLLLASSMLTDPNFHRSVILMVQHDPDGGAMGLILNRPLQANIKEVCTEQFDFECAVDGPLHLGGPCEQTLMVLYSESSPAETSDGVRVMDGICLASDKSKIESLLLDPQSDVKCFVGYAGWAPGQLEAEIEHGAWLATPATREEIFRTGAGDGAGKDQWQELMNRLTLGKYIDPDRMPEDPNLN